MSSNERKIWDTADHANFCETRYNISQLQMLSNGKAFLAGAGEAGYPGAVQIWSFPMEYIGEVQAHAGPIERMRLSYHNDWLFTAGRDCCLMIHEVKDRSGEHPTMPHSVATRGLAPRPTASIVRDPNLLYSDEILTEKSEMDEINAERDRLMNDLASARDPSHTGVNEKASANDLEDKIKKLKEQISSQELMIRSKIE